MSIPSQPSAEVLRTDDAAWDAFVASSRIGTFHQQTGWLAVTAERWERSVRVVTGSMDGLIGAQVLVHRVRPGPWSRGWAPRGPVAARYTDASISAFTDALRRDARRLRLIHVFIDPELPAGDAAGHRLEAAGWRRADAVHPTRTLVIHLERSESELWSDLRSSARWSVNKARRGGISAHPAGAQGLADFGRLYSETAARVDFKRRAPFEAAFRSFEQMGAATIMLARDPGGEPLATLMLITCGDRIFELYGASSRAGLKSRANYLVKWEAIRLAKERGHRWYDVYGTDWANLAEFKAGFGGQERIFGGPYQLVTDRPGWLALEAFDRSRSVVRRITSRGQPDGPADG